MAVIGKSGSGKSVFLKHIAGLIQPDAGEVIVAGHNLCCLRPRQLQKLRQTFGFVFQGGALFDNMSVYENVAFPLREKTRLAAAEIDAKVMAELADVGLTDSLHKYPAQLSGGMVKRAALARALVLEPPILFFDEPTTGLDPVIGGDILRLIHTVHAKRRFTGIIVSHNIPDVFEIVTLVGVLIDGRIQALTTPAALRQSGDPQIREFIASGHFKLNPDER